jgi:hypothetical protein
MNNHAWSIWRINVSLNTEPTNCAWTVTVRILGVPVHVGKKAIVG